jgi:MEDS: MEthanogen/methylotroph, DcmR Sensory domain
MNVSRRGARSAVTSEHTVQFFDSSESRIENVAAFLKAGYDAGEPLIVIARASHWSAFKANLQQHGVPVTQLIASGRLIARDATDTVEALRPRARFDPQVFDRIIASAVRNLGAGSTVRAYGEMVDILAEQRDFAGALELEALWNGLAQRLPINLLCGYCSAHFVSASSNGILSQICTAHGHVRHDEQDQLGSWLVAGANCDLPTAN